MTKPLAILGAAALLAWTGMGVLAWWKVGNEVSIVFQEEGAGDGELALLEDRLGALEGDLEALTASLQENFGLLAGALEGGASGADEARLLGRLEQRLSDLESALPPALQARETAGELRAALTRLEQLVAGTGRGLAPPALAPPALATTEEEPLAQQSELADAQEPVITESPSQDSQPQAPGPARSFLAFRLPSRDFRFAGSQDFRILEGLSRVGFDARSTLHDFTGVSERVSGDFRVDLARPQDGIQGRIAIASSTLDTGLAGRDEKMHEHLDAETHGQLVFEPSAIELEESSADEQRLAGVLHGRMTIHGTTREVEMAFRAHVDESRRLVIEGEMPLLMADYGVHVPTKLGMISMEDEVRVWIHLRARASASEALR